MSETWLILDCPYLAHRAVAAMGNLSFEGETTAVVFGLARDLIDWSELFGTDKFVFCFDAGRNKRLDIYPEYKQHRWEHVSEDAKSRRVMVRRQICRLREEDLFRIGYRNVFWERGYESDDVIASVVLESIPREDEAVIVSADADFWQLISPTVCCYDPKQRKRRTLQWFSKMYGLSPSQWADVKALAGCSTDNVRGIELVGEKSAAAFLRGKMKEHHKRYKSIVEGDRIWRRNLQLVQLPFAGCPRFELRSDVVTKERWRKFCKRHGIRSLMSLYPGRK